MTTSVAATSCQKSNRLVGSKILFPMLPAMQHLTYLLQVCRVSRVCCADWYASRPGKTVRAGVSYKVVDNSNSSAVSEGCCVMLLRKA